MSGPPDVWSGFTHDPRDPQYAAIRASDQDRALVQQVLGDAYADGRLDRTEYDERSERVGGLRVLGDLTAMLSDLVPPPGSVTGSLAGVSRSDLEQRAERAWVTRRREAVFSFLGPSLICCVIWLATSWGDDGFEPYFPWPIFVIVFTGLHLLRTMSRHEEIVEEEVRRLEKRQAKELRARRDP